MRRQTITAGEVRSAPTDPDAISAKFVVSLSETQRDRPDALTGAGRSRTGAIRPARTLLLAAASDGGPARDDERIAAAPGQSPAAAARTRERFVAEGLEQVPRPRPRRPGRSARPALAAAPGRTLDALAGPRGPGCPAVRLDERPCASVGEGRDPLPMRPGTDVRQDRADVRGPWAGVAALA